MIPSERLKGKKIGGTEILEILDELWQRTCDHSFETVRYENRKECRSCELSKELE